MICYYRVGKRRFVSEANLQCWLNMVSGRKYNTHFAFYIGLLNF